MTQPTERRFRTVTLMLGTCAMLAACGGTGPNFDNLDWDLRGGNAMTTRNAALGPAPPALPPTSAA